MTDRGRVEELIEAAGYEPGDSVVVGVRSAQAEPFFASRGRCGPDAIVYTASVAKQITAACVALLVRDGRLDLQSDLGRWMPALPAWAASVRMEHLIHHTSGLPDVSFGQLQEQGLDRTNEVVIGALDRLEREPGREFHYCNAGYVCLGVVVEQVSGQSLSSYAREHVFEPLGMSASRYWAGPEPFPPGAVPLETSHPAPLSVGDGGLWSTARDLMRWNRAMEQDELGVAAMMQTPGRLDDGAVVPYGWGVGIRPGVYRHGGLWAGLSAQIGRVGDGRAGFVVVALDQNEERTAGLADALIAELSAGVREALH